MGRDESVATGGDLSAPVLARLISTARPLTGLSHIGLTQPGYWTGAGCPAEGFPVGSIVDPSRLEQLVAEHGAFEITVRLDDGVGEQLAAIGRAAERAWDEFRGGGGRDAYARGEGLEIAAVSAWVDTAMAAALPVAEAMPDLCAEFGVDVDWHWEHARLIIATFGHPVVRCFPWPSPLTMHVHHVIPAKIRCGDSRCPQGAVATRQAVAAEAGAAPVPETAQMATARPGGAAPHLG